MDKNKRIITFPIVDTAIDYHDFSSNANFLSQLINERVEFEELGYCVNHRSYVGVYYLTNEGLDDSVLEQYKTDYELI